MKYIEAPFLNWWREHADGYQAVLFDVDGTLVSGPRMMPGADCLIDWLRSRGYPFYLLTNDGNNSTQEKSELIRRSGLEIAADEIVSCSMALNGYVENSDFHGKTVFVMGDLGKPCYALKAGLQVSRDIKQLDACDGIIVGEGFYDWQKTIHAVLNSLIRNPARPLLVPNPDSYWPDGKHGGYGIGAGGKARFICTILNEMGINLEPTYLGKPYPAIYEYTVELLKRRFKLDAIHCGKIIMIGDSLKSDIRGANNVGMASALMLTGITTETQARKATDELRPDFVFSSLG